MRPATTGRAPPPKAKLSERLRPSLPARHYRQRTEDAYVSWVRRFALFCRMRIPAEIGEPAINAFLTHLALTERVGAPTQNLALAALLFLDHDVLRREVR
ncbi:MAG: hypothetical protein KatS3mg015_2580 [Fimbriimonadales bacterium]|nr:MAG: hypothetical protein KatS3mg015_2580 [Fimbriimonadales bacterium]